MQPPRPSSVLPRQVKSDKKDKRLPDTDDYYNLDDVDDPLENKEVDALGMPFSSGTSTMTNETEEKMLTEVTRARYYYGMMDLVDLEEMLPQRGDYCLKGDGRQCQLVVRTRRMKLLMVPIKFVEKDGRQCTLNGKVTSRTGIVDLMTLHQTGRIAVDEQHTFLEQAVNCPSWQLKKENIVMDKKIGEGAFGTVWSGSWIDDKKQLKRVAIKVAKLVKENRAKMDDLLTEARFMRQLNHPYVVRFYGMVMTDGEEATIVMELVEGGSLLHHLQKNTNIAPAVKARLCFHVAYGLNYLHTMHLLHRDLASRNCLLDRPTMTVKISDFGMSKTGKKYKIDPKEKTAIRWMAPEVLQTAIYTKECDLWAMGMTFYEIFSNGRPPFDGIASTEIRQNLSDPSFRPTLPPDVPGPLREVIAELWSADPAKRTRTLKACQRIKAFVDKERQKKYLSSGRKPAPPVINGEVAVPTPKSRSSRRTARLKAVQGSDRDRERKRSRAEGKKKVSEVAKKTSRLKGSSARKQSNRNE